MTTSEGLEVLVVDGTNCALLIAENYGKIPVKAKKQIGWADLTILIQDELGEEYIFKIFQDHFTSDASQTEAEIALLKHLENSSLPVPIVLPTKSGKFFGEADFTNEAQGVHRKRFRLQTYIKGSILHKSFTEDISSQVGDIAGKVDVCLTTFSHPYYESKGYPGVLMNFIGLDTREMIPKIANEKFRRLAESYVKMYEQKIELNHSKLPTQQIHGDLHGRNVIVNDEKTKVVGLIDLSDSTKTLRIIEAAVTLSGIALCDVDVAACMKAFLEAYEKHVPLTKIEKEALPIAVAGRLVQVMAINNFMALTNPSYDPSYALSVYASAWNVIEDIVSGEGIISRFFNDFASS